MNTHSLPRAIPLQRPLAWRLVDSVVDQMRASAAQFQLRRAAYAEYRRALQAERELAQLSPRTLQDIGAPQGLVGQRRWQDDEEAARVARILNHRGW